MSRALSICAGGSCPGVLAGPSAPGLCAACRRAFRLAGVHVPPKGLEVEPVQLPLWREPEPPIRKRAA
jgi:hypothetical protein